MIEKECLAVKWAVDAPRYYLTGRAFNLVTDHAPLKWLHSMKDTNSRITRWYLALQPQTDGDAMFTNSVPYQDGVDLKASV
ncbi:UNVERIFIED_CONTAM: hypothetical protein FKN15_002986 [Acipenser sinensis]